MNRVKFEAYITYAKFYETTDMKNSENNIPGGLACITAQLSETATIS